MLTTGTTIDIKTLSYDITWGYEIENSDLNLPVNYVARAENTDGNVFSQYLLTNVQYQTSSNRFYTNYIRNVINTNTNEFLGADEEFPTILSTKEKYLETYNYPLTGTTSGNTLTFGEVLVKNGIELLVQRIANVNHEVNMFDSNYEPFQPLLFDPDTSGSTTIVIETFNSVGTPEYSLDGSSFQTGNTFTGLTGTTYTVYVKDNNNPSGITEDISFT